jgi:membrane associated rhomboid family serine protease
MPSLHPVTKALMLICAVVFCAQLLLPLDALLALFPLGSGHFWPWQLISYAFLHGNLAHLLFNMLGLWVFGADLERLWGRQRYLQLLGAGALTAGLTQLLVNLPLGSMAPTLGASGAIFGLLLAYGMVFPQRQFDLMGLLPMLLISTGNQFLGMLGTVLFVVMLTSRSALPWLKPIPVKAMVMVAIYGAVELYMGVTSSRSGIAHFAHLGGMLGAWLMINWWRGRLPGRPRR